MTDFHYVGEELSLFSHAHNWKAYWAKQTRPFIAGDTLEVGAGIGSNTSLLDPGGPGAWVCLEPDARLCEPLSASLKAARQPRYEVVCGSLRDMGDRLFDTILYIDVLEHIEDDRGELAAAASHLRPNGRVVVLSPAHQRLFSPFDAAIGHFRRYNRSMLQKISPQGLETVRIQYLDCVGLAASLANGLFLRQSMPTLAQIRFWDGMLVPVSRAIDGLFGFNFGKSILGVWRKP